MKLTTKGRYGTRLMLDLALHFGEQPVFLKDAAKRQGISEKYLWHLIPPLKNAGLITSVRGAHGGYSLARSPDRITLKEILLAVEGPISFVSCVGGSSACARSETCATKDIWSEISEKFLQILESFTLEDIVEKQKSKSGSSAAYNYVI
ncbi:MAG: Rrf2 family transcriptional regulator [Candidatus Omnitrophica bacterium]|nr:Rrf2 family transcriptional regulator [Candidatus Omnitrophota bacterium]